MNLPAGYTVTGIDRDRLDLEKVETVRSILGDLDFDVLINAAGYHATDAVETDGARAMAINAHAVREMALACAEQTARLVHISTDYVFGGDADRRVPYAEDDATAPPGGCSVPRWLPFFGCSSVSVFCACFRQPTLP